MLQNNRLMQGVKKIVVYADILIVLNLIVNYFLLLATSKILREKIKTPRIVFSSLTGAVSSLYIFLPSPPFLAEVLFKVSLCFIMASICFGVGSFRRILKSALLLFAITCGYAGIMMAVWNLFKPSGMIINNSVVYFNVSPIILVGSSAGVYFLFVIFNFLLKRNNRMAEECEITVSANGSAVDLKAILDSGNSLTDIFGKSEIIIADKSVCDKLFKNSNPQEKKLRFRMIPCNTVSGNDLLEGYRCDEATVMGNSKTVTLKKPILAVSKTPLNEGYNAIINPEILN